MKRILSTLIFALFCFGLIAQADTIFVLGAEFGAVTVVDDSTFQVSSEHPADQLGQGFLPTQIKVGYRLFDINGRLFRVSSIVSSNFGESVLQVVELQDNNIGPIGVGVVYRKPTDSDCVPIIPQGNTGLSPAIVAKIHNHNAVVGCGSGSGGGATVTSLPADSITVTPIVALPATTNVQQGLAEAGTNINALDILLADLTTLSGMPATSTDLGTFTGVTIPDASDTKESLQALETLGESKQKTVYFDNVAALLDATLSVGDVAITKGFSAVGDGGESTFYVRADSVSGYTTDSIAVIPVSSGFAVMDATKDVDVRAFGAKDVANYFIRKNPTTPATPTASDYSDAAFGKCIDFLNNRMVINTKTNPSTMVYDGQYYIDTLTLEPLNGVQIQATGGSYIHYNALDTCVNIVGHYGMEHRINVSHRTWMGATTRLWYPSGTDTVAVDSTSIGVRIENSRNNKFYISALKFMTGQLLQGVADGNVNNITYPGTISQNRYNIRLLNVSGGWSNSNIWTGGQVNGTGLVGRNYAIDIDCAFIQNNSGNSNIFQGLNLEGSQNYKYAIYNEGSFNDYVNCRLEGIKAKQIFFTGANSKITGYGDLNIAVKRELGLYYSTDGTVGNIPKNPDGTNIEGYIYNDIGTIPVIEGNGSIWFPGGDTYTDLGENITMTLESKSTVNPAKLLRVLRNEKEIFNITASGEVDYYGPNGLSQFQKFTNLGLYDTVTYSTGNWISNDKFIDDSGTLYFSRKTFIADGTISNDVTNGNLVAVSGETSPAVKFRDNGIGVEQIGGINDTSGVTRSPKLVNGIVFEQEIPITVSSATYTLNPVAKSIVVINHSIASSECAITIDVTDLENGAIFAVTNGITNGSWLKIIAGGTVKALDGSTEINLSYRHVSYFLKVHNIVLEIFNSKAGRRSIGTTAQRPSLNTSAANHLYFDTTIHNWIRWTGSAWVVVTPHLSGAATPIGATTPRWIGDEYLQTTDDIWYKSYGLTNTEWKPINSVESRAFMSVVGGSTSFISGTPERLDGDTPGTTTDVSSTSDWTVSGSVMTYTGTATRDFEVHAEISTSLATTGDATYYISKNSTIITPGTRRDHGNDDVGAASITWIVSMSTSDTIDVRVDAPTDETCNVQNYSVKVKEW